MQKIDQEAKARQRMQRVPERPLESMQAKVRELDRPFELWELVVARSKVIAIDAASMAIGWRTAM